MRMKIYGMLAGVIACLTLTACEPEPKPDPEPDNGTASADSWVISHAKYFRDDIGHDIEYKYDTKGRIIQLVDLYLRTGIMQSWCTFSYTSSEIIPYHYAGDYPDTSVEYEGERIKIVNGLIKNLRHYNDKNELTTLDYKEEYSLTWKDGNIDKISFYDWYDEDNQAMNTVKLRYSNHENVNPACVKALNAFILSELDGLPTGGGSIVYPKFEYTVGGFYGNMPCELINEFVFDWYWYWTDEVLYNAVERLSFSDIDENGCPGTMTVYHVDGSLDYYYFQWTKQ